MALNLVRTDKEINDLMNSCALSIDEGERRFPSMSYAECIYEALKWATGQTDDHPFEDE